MTKYQTLDMSSEEKDQKLAEMEARYGMNSMLATEYFSRLKIFFIQDHIPISLFPNFPLFSFNGYLWPSLNFEL